MDKEEVLQNFGLTEAEVTLYLTLLKWGEATASTLAKETNTNRTFTYDRLKKLLDLGLIGFVIKDNKKYFKATEPSQLLAILKEKEEHIKAILPELENLKTKLKLGPEVQVFTSKQGVKTALNLVLREKEETYIYGSVQKFKAVMGEFYTIWNQRRLQEKIPVKLLSNEPVKMELADIDLLLEEEKSSMTTFTFGNKLVMVLWSDVPVAILIESKEIAQSHRAFLNTILQREIRIYSGVEGIRKAFFDLVSQRTSIHYGIGYSWALAQIYGPEMSDEWHILRLKNNIASKLIAYDDQKSKDYFKARMKKWKNFHVTFLDRNICGPACVTLSDHIIAIFIYTEKNLKVIVSKNKEMIQAYKRHFENLWRKTG